MLTLCISLIAYLAMSVPWDHEAHDVGQFRPSTRQHSSAFATERYVVSRTISDFKSLFHFLLCPNLNNFITTCTEYCADRRCVLRTRHAALKKKQRKTHFSPKIYCLFGFTCVDVHLSEQKVHACVHLHVQMHNFL